MMLRHFTRRLITNTRTRRAVGMLCAFAIAFAVALTISNRVEAAVGIYAPISYQGKVSLTAGTAVSNGSYNMRFKIFTAVSGGTAVWTETWSNATQRVTMTGGLFSVALGTQTAMTGSVDFNSDSLFLQVEFDPGNDGVYEEVFSPRRRFSSVPYAHNANALDGRDATRFVWNDVSQVMSGTLTISPRNAARVGLNIYSTAGFASSGALRLSTQGANHILFGTGATTFDTNLYRRSAAVLKTDGEFWANTVSGATLYARSTLRSSGSLVVDGTGLVKGNLTTNGTLSGNALTVTSLKNCALILTNTAGVTSCGSVATLGDSRFVNVGGDTMTGTLVIQNGNTHSATATALLNVRGTMSGRSLYISGTGSTPLLVTNNARGRVSVGTGALSDGPRFTSFSSTKAQGAFYGYDPGIGAGNANGLITLGNNPAQQGIIHYEGSNGIFYIDNPSTNGLVIRADSDGTPTTAGFSTSGLQITSGTYNTILGDGNNAYGLYIQDGTRTVSLLEGAAPTASFNDGTDSVSILDGAYLLNLDNTFAVDTASNTTINGSLTLGGGINTNFKLLVYQDVGAQVGLAIRGNNTAPLQKWLNGAVIQVAAMSQSGWLVIGKTTSATTQIDVVGTISGSALTVTSLKNCALILTNSAGVTSCGSVATLGDSRYVNVAGDTMTGTLVIQNGNTHSATATALLNVRGTMSGRLLYVTGTGSTPLLMTSASNRVGIGTATPKAKLDVLGTISGSLITQNGAGNNYFMGNLGVGTASPIYKLDVQGGTTRLAASGTPAVSAYALSVQRTDVNSVWIEMLNNGGAGQGAFFGLSNSDFQQWNYQGGPISFFTHPSVSNGTLRMAIEADGDVAMDTDTFFMDESADSIGINTATPKASLDVLGTISGAGLMVNGSSVMNGPLTMNGNLSPNNGNIYNIGADTKRIRQLFLTGSLRIGSDSSFDGRIDYNQSGAEGLMFYGLGSNSTPDIFVSSGSKVGIGTITPNAKLDVAGTISGTNLTVTALKNCALIMTSSAGVTSCGSVGTLGDSRYVNVAGDTMTGTLVIQNGNTHSATATALLNVRGTMSGVSLYVTGTGASPLLTTNISTGRVGVGTATPKVKLDVVGTISGSLITQHGAGTNSFRGLLNLKPGQTAVQSIIFGTAVRGLGLDTSGYLSMWASAGRGITFRDDANSGYDGNVLMFVEGGGNVGIGKSNITPNAKLEVVGTISGTALTVSSLRSCPLIVTSSIGVTSCGSVATIGDSRFVNVGGDTMTGTLVIQNGNTHSATATALLNVRGTMSGRSLYISGTGSSPLLTTNIANNRVGVGTAAPKATLDIVGTISGALITQNGAGNNSLMGNLGIGKTTPVTKLEVMGTISGSALSINGNGTFKGPGNVYADGAFYGAYSLASGDAFFIGNDSKLSDIGVANTAGLYGIQDGTVGSVKLGSAGGTVSGFNGNVGINNLIAKATFDVRGTISGSLITQNGAGNNYLMGNLGIGKTTPVTKLEVVGTISGSTLSVTDLKSCALIITNSAGVASCGSVANIGDSRFVNVGGDTMTGTLVIQNGNTHSATATALLNVRGTMSGRSLYISGTGASALLTTNITTGRVGINANGLVETFNVTGTSYFKGNVGIQTFAPSVELEVLGTISGSLITQYGTGNNYFQGNVGIGSTTPKAKLDIVGTLSGRTLAISNSGSILGNLAIGRVNAKATLDVAGTISGTSLTVTSLKNCALILTNSAGVTSCGSVATIGDSRYVNVAGDTMTGTLVIQNGNTHSTTATALLNVRGTMSGITVYANSQLRSSGSLAVETTGVFGGNLTTRGILSGASLEVSGASYVRGNLTVDGDAAFYGNILTAQTSSAISFENDNGIASGGGLLTLNYGSMNFSADAATMNLTSTGDNDATLTITTGLGDNNANLVLYDLFTGGTVTMANNPTDSRFDITSSFPVHFLNASSVNVANDFNVLTGNATVSTGYLRAQGSVQESPQSVDRIDLGVENDSPRMVFENYNGITSDTWEIDNDAGIFRWYTPGIVEMAMSTTATWLPTNSFGIGTTGPDRQLDVLSTSAAQARLTYTDNSVYTDLLSNSNGYFSIDATGNRVGIETSAPKATLDVRGTMSGRTLAISSSGSVLGNLAIGRVNAKATLDVAGTISGTSLTVTSLKNCALILTDSAGVTSCGSVTTLGDSRYVNVSGDTMTGTLVIQNGNTHSATATALLNVRGTMSGRSIYVTGTGASPLFVTNITTGRVSVGSAAPKAKLDVVGTISGSLISQNGAGNNYFGGSIGMGTLAPASLLHMLGNTDAAYETLRFQNANAGSNAHSIVRFFNDVSQAGFYFNSSGRATDVGTNGFGFYNDATNGALQFRTAGRVYFQSNGTAERLSLGQTTEAVFNDPGNDYDFRMEGDTDASLFVLDAGADRIGVGTATPKAKLDVVGTISGTALTVTSLKNCALILTDSAGVTSCGSVGTLGDSRYVNVAGDTMTGTLVIQNGNTHSATATALLNVRGTMSGRSLYISGTGASALLTTNITTGRVGVGTAAPKAKLDVVGSISGSTLVINGLSTFNGNLVPFKDNAYDLGTTSTRFRSVYLSGGSLHLGSSTHDAIIGANVTGAEGMTFYGKASNTYPDIFISSGSQIAIGAGTARNGSDKLFISGNTTVKYGTLTVDPRCEELSGIYVCPFPTVYQTEILGRTIASETYIGGTFNKFDSENGDSAVTIMNDVTRDYFKSNNFSVSYASVLTMTGSSYFTGNMGIGKKVAGTKLEVAGTISGTALTVTSLKNCALIVTNSAGVTSCGSVATIGDSRFVNVGGDTMTGTLVIQNGNTHSATATALLNVRGTMSGRSLYITGTGSTPLLATNVATGFVGIGTSTPGYALEIINTSGVAIKPGSRAYQMKAFDAGGQFIFIRSDAPTGGLSIQPDTGSTKISSVDVTSRLVFAGGNSMYLNVGEGGGGGNIVFGKRSSDDVVLPTTYQFFGGNMGVGTATPGAKLAVSGSTVIGDNIGSRVAKATLDVVGTMSGRTLAISNSGSILGNFAIGKINAKAKLDVLGTISGSALVINGLSTFNGNLVPSRDNASDLGTTSARWRQLYLSGGSLHLGTSSLEGKIGFKSSGFEGLQLFGSGTAVNPQVFISTGGLVGIGTVTPKARFEVVGTISGSTIRASKGLASSGSLVVLGATRLKSTLQVDGATTFSNSTTFNSTASFNSALYGNSTNYFGGTNYLTGNTYLNSASTAGSVLITGDGTQLTSDPTKFFYSESSDQLAIGGNSFVGSEKLHLLGAPTGTTVNDVTGFYGSLLYFSGNYNANCNSHEYYIYGYKNVNGTYVFSSNGQYAGPYSDDCSTNAYSVELYWDSNANLDGYIIFKQDNVAPYSFYDAWADVGNTTTFSDNPGYWNTGGYDVSNNTYGLDSLYAEGNATFANNVAASTYTGTWTGNAIGVSYGGTGNTGYTSNALLYYNGSNFASAPALTYSTSTQNVLITATSAAVRPLVVKGTTAQNANLQEWQNSAGTIRASMSQSGWLAINKGSVKAKAGLDVLGTMSGSNLVISGSGTFVNNTAARVALTVKAAPSQSTNIMEWKLSNNAAQLAVTSAGALAFIESSGATGVGTLAADSTYGGVIFTAGTANFKVLGVRGQANQVAALQEWQKNDGTIYSSMSQSGWLAIGKTTKAKAQVDVVGTISGSSILVNGLTRLSSGATISTKAGSSLAFTNIGDRPVIQFNDTASDAGLSIRNHVGTEIARFQDNGAFFVNSFNTSGGLYVADFYMQRGNSQKMDLGDNGQAAFGFAGGSTTYSEYVKITNANAATKALVIKGVAAQTANLTEWQNSANTVLSSMSQSGWLAIGRGATATNQLSVSGSQLIDSDETNTTNNSFRIVTNAGSANNVVFRIQANGASFSDNAHTTTGADYAEYFASSDYQSLSNGDLVCVDTTQNNAVRKCRTASDPNLMGIISTKPAFIGNGIEGVSITGKGVVMPGFVLVGLIGQVPAKVIVESGASIQPGDSLTSAARTGFARKANPGETTVGVALEGIATGEGMINVLISRTNKSLTVEMLEDRVRDEIAAMEIGDEIEARINLALSGSNVAQNLLTDLQMTLNPTLTTLTTGVTNLQAQLNTLQAAVAAIPQTNGGISATSTGTITAGNIISEDKLTVASDARIGGDLYLEGILRVNTILVPGGMTVDGALTTGKLTAASGSIVDGMLTVNDLTINHQLTMSSGSILNVSDLFVRGAMVVMGPITVDGLATFLGDVEVKGELIVSAKQAGYALLPKGLKSVTVSFGSGGFVSIPVVTASPDVPVLYGVSKATATGFTIRIAAAAEEDITFSWLALGTMNAQTASGALSIGQTAFMVDALGVPVSSNPVWNACIRNIATFDAEGQPMSCSRYHDFNQWEHPDLNIFFIWNDTVTPAYLDLPEGYVATIGGNAVLPEGTSSSSSVSSEESSSSEEASSSESSVSSSSEESSSSVSSSESSVSSSESSSSEAPPDPAPPSGGSQSGGGSGSSAGGGEGSEG